MLSLCAATLNTRPVPVKHAADDYYQTRARDGLSFDYDVAADGQRFLINTLPEQAGPAPITVVVNWTARLRR